MGFLSKIFGSKQKESKEIQIFSPLSGEIVNIEDVPDVVSLRRLWVMAWLSIQMVILSLRQ